MVIHWGEIVDHFKGNPLGNIVDHLNGNPLGNTVDHLKGNPALTHDVVTSVRHRVMIVQHRSILAHVHR